MFAIGATLRAARLARNLELEAIAQQTMIRTRYLAALEDERFEALPGDVYARIFLREYAELLGLDPRPFLDELDSRLGESEPSPLILLPPARRSLLGTKRVLTLVAAAAAVAVGLLAWRFGGEHRPQLPVPTPPTRPPLTVRPRAQPQPAPSRARPAAPELRLAASRGDCWLSVRVGSRDGQVVYEGLLRAGGSLRFHRRRLWIRIGAPWNLDVRLNGRKIGTLPPRTGNVLFAASVLQPA
jgi:transcriptional regulator with XRE-family HTH domain